jgi:uncharacterized protein YukE
MGMGFDVDTKALSGLADDLDEAGRALSKHRDDLDVAPDVGRSSDETGQALAGLATAVAGLAEHIGDLSESLRETATTYDEADRGTDARFREFA